MAVLKDYETYLFNDLFEKVYQNLKKRNAVSGGEEMLRLRAYEKLQNLVGASKVLKQGKTYTGLPGIETVAPSVPPRAPVVP